MISIEDIPCPLVDMNFIFERLTQTFSEHFPKIAEHFGRQPKISEEGLTMFPSYNNTSEYFLRDYMYVACNGSLKTCDNNLLFSHVKISCLCAKLKLTWYFTGVYIIKIFYLWCNNWNKLNNKFAWQNK